MQIINHNQITNGLKLKNMSLFLPDAACKTLCNQITSILFNKTEHNFKNSEPTIYPRFDKFMGVFLETRYIFLLLIGGNSSNTSWPHQNKFLTHRKITGHGIIDFRRNNEVEMAYLE